MTLTMNLGERSYDIVIERGALKKCGEYLNLNRKVFIVTDSGVPYEYAETVAKFCKEPYITVVPEGEESKGFTQFERLLSLMLEKGFSRKDCVVAVGGGVVGDLSGFTAASYMRGIDFYNIPTTVLSQVDSSIGGKTAINLDGIKNIVGAFYQPKRVLVDADVLDTLPSRQISNGLAEAVKMSLTSNAELFSLFESGNVKENLEKIITESLKIKKYVVEQDEKEGGLRKILNFGHTIGHGIESFEELNGLYHGECVSLGMIPMCGENIRGRVINVLKSLNLPTTCDFDIDEVYAAMTHDKKTVGENVTVTEVDEIGKFTMKKITLETLKEKLPIIKQ